MNDKIKQLLENAEQSDAIARNKWRIENREQLRKERKEKLKELMEKDILNLTPAKQLINKFYYQLPNNGYLNEGLLSCDKRYKEAIACAIVCVEEIIGTLNRDIRDLDVRGNVLLDLIEYWREIETELIQIQNDNRGTT
jgi:hypothetical protein